MRNLFSRRTLMVAAAAVMVSGGLGGGIAAATDTPAAPAAAATAATAPHPIPYPQPGTGGVALSAVPGATPDSSCQPYVNGDHVHYSKKYHQASGHGWWIQNDCPRVKITVTVTLQEYFSDKKWHDEGSGSKKVYPGDGGTANRATGKVDCRATSPIAGWRSKISVTYGKGATGYTPAQNIDCRT